MRKTRWRGPSTAGSSSSNAAAEFDFLAYASSHAELRDYMAKEGAYDEGPEDEADKAAKAELYPRVEQTWRAAGEGAEVVRRERARIARLRPLWEVDP